MEALPPSGGRTCRLEMVLMVDFCSPPVPFNVLEVLQMTLEAGCTLASILVGVGSLGGRDGVPCPIISRSKKAISWRLNVDKGRVCRRFSQFNAALSTSGRVILPPPFPNKWDEKSTVSDSCGAQYWCDLNGSGRFYPGLIRSLEPVAELRHFCADKVRRR